MRGINKVIILGTLGADPEVRQFSNGGSVTNISVATSEQWTDKQSGEKRESTEWHRIALFNRVGEIAAQYLRKGSKVYIEGSIHTRKYQAQDGTDRYATEIKGLSLQMLDSAGGGSNENQNQGSAGRYQNADTPPPSQPPVSNPPAANKPKSMPTPGPSDDDIPFAPHFGG